MTITLYRGARSWFAIFAARVEDARPIPLTPETRAVEVLAFVKERFPRDAVRLAPRVLVLSDTQGDNATCPDLLDAVLGVPA